MTSGTPRIDYISLEDLLEIAAGVIGDVRVRDLGALESCAMRTQTTVFGEETYPTLADKAAALLHAVARNDPLVDRNKHLAWAAMRASCGLNGYDLRYDVDEAETVVIAVATGSPDMPKLGSWLSERLVRNLGAS